MIGLRPGEGLSGVVRPQPSSDGQFARAVLARVGLLVVAVLVVLMHHVMSAQVHGADAAMRMPAAASAAPADAAHDRVVPSAAVSHFASVHVPPAEPASAAAADEPSPAPAAAVATSLVTTTSSASNLVPASSAMSAMSAMLHLCLAVLVAVGLVVALILAVISGQLRWAPATTAPGSSSAFPRPPPLRRRLARLQVLRL